MSVLRRNLCRLALLALIAPSGCGGDSGTSPSGTSSTPQITSCNALTYKGTTYSNLGCAPGIASFTSTISVGGSAPACFNITCSAGCVSAARVC